MIMRSLKLLSFLLVSLCAVYLICVQMVVAADWSIHPDLQEYFESEVKSIEAESYRLLHPENAEQWERQKPELRRQLAEMLGLDPMPAKTPLSPVVTGRIQKEGYSIENLHFQSMPGLYVTGNLYLPDNVETPLPAILYVCGHAHAKEGDLSFGNKTAYQHHGIWFAKHGFVCLTIDTIQLGEIEGIHHGTYRYDRWWWNSRGYTPAGVEAWNGIRALDYLQSRPEVDGKRLGITGRSGGGVYSWWVAALDERVQAVVPVAGITDLRNYVVDGAVEGHCDCMFMVNTYRWDYPMIASLIAPRPLLIANSDKDSIFPLDGVLRTHRQVRDIYSILDAEDQLGLLITEGPHKDTQDLQVPAFRWFQRWLKASDDLVETAAIKELKPEGLRVFDALPEDENVTTVDTVFVKQSSHWAVPRTLADWDLQISKFRNILEQKTFSGFRPIVDELEITRTFPFWNYTLTSDNPAVIEILNSRDLLDPISTHKHNQIRRRYMLIGQTLDSTRVMELKQTLQTLLSKSNKTVNDHFLVKAKGDMAVNAIYAGLLLEGESSAQNAFKFHLSDLPPSHMSGPDYLNIMKSARLEESLAALSRRYEVTVENGPVELQGFVSKVKAKLGPEACTLNWIETH